MAGRTRTSSGAPPPPGAGAFGRLADLLGRQGTQWAAHVAGQVAGGVASRVDLDALGDKMLAAIDEAAESRWEAATERARQLPGELRPDKLAALTRSFTRELTALGAAAGAAAAAPAVGTVASLAATATELAWFAARSGDLVLTIAALHGRPTPTVDERRAWVLAVLLYGGSAQEGFTTAAGQLGITLDQHTPARLPIASLQAINSRLSALVVRRYCTRRGLVVAASTVPLGIGAVIGGGANYVAVRNLARHADRFFAKLPYSSIEVEAREVGGMIGPGRRPRPA